MSLIGGLLAGAAQGVSDSWTNRRLELKEEAANAFKQAAVKVQAQQFNIAMVNQNEQKRLDRAANKDLNLTKMNANAKKNWQKEIKDLRNKLAEDKITQKVHDEYVADADNVLRGLGLTVPSEGKRGSLDELGADGLTAAELEEANRVKEAAAALELEKGSVKGLIAQAYENENKDLDPKVIAAQDFIKTRTRDPGNRAINVVGDSLSEVGKTITGLFPDLSGLSNANRLLAIMNRGGYLSEGQYKVIMDSMTEDNGMSKPENVQMYKKAKESLNKLIIAKSGSANN